MGGDRGPDRPGPDEPSIAPVVADLTIGEAEFLLHDEGEGCVALEVRHPGLQSTVERRCFEREVVVVESTRCGWLEGPEAAAGSALADSFVWECEVDLPAVLYGKVAEPNIAHVCLGTMVGEGPPEVTVRGARFLRPGNDGFILEPARADEVSAAHLFTADGLRYGTPPLDAPSAPIYEACEALAPWGETGIEYHVVLRVAAELEPPGDDAILFFDTGLEAVGVDLRAFEDMAVIDLPGRLGASSAGLTVGFEAGVTRRSAIEYPWPADLQSLLRSGRPCTDPIFLEVLVGEGFPNSPEAVSISMQPASCGR